MKTAMQRVGTVLPAVLFMSSLEVAQAAEIAKRVDVPIYTMGYKLPLDERLLSKHKRAPGLTPVGIVASLESFARATGGKAFFLNAPAELSAALGDVAARTVKAGGTTSAPSSCWRGVFFIMAL